MISGRLLRTMHQIACCWALKSRFLFDGINERYGKKIPVAVIDSGDYGSLNGERVLKLAILEMKRHQVDVNADK
jgi:hypothetical protein